jgi:hypothetical protein
MRLMRRKIYIVFLVLILYTIISASSVLSANHYCENNLNPPVDIGTFDNPTTACGERAIEYGATSFLRYVQDTQACVEVYRGVPIHKTNWKPELSIANVIVGGASDGAYATGKSPVLYCRNYITQITGGEVPPEGWASIFGAWHPLTVKAVRDCIDNPDNDDSFQFFDANCLVSVAPPPPENLIHHYDFNDPDNPTADVVGGMNGVNNGATYEPVGGPDGSGAFRFTPVNQRIGLPGTKNLGLPYGSVAVWAKFDGDLPGEGNAFSRYIFGGRYGNDYGQLFLRYAGAPQSRANRINYGMRGRLTGNDWSIGWTTNHFEEYMGVNDGWHHYVVVWGPAETKLYLDGVENYVGLGNVLNGHRTNDMAIGTQSDVDNDRGWNGWIDDFRIYDYALSAAAVQEVMDEGQVGIQCDPTPEICDAIDNNCDGEIDERENICSNVFSGEVERLGCYHVSDGQYWFCFDEIEQNGEGIFVTVYSGNFELDVNSGWPIGNPGPIGTGSDVDNPTFQIDNAQNLELTVVSYTGADSAQIQIVNRDNDAMVCETGSCRFNLECENGETQQCGTDVGICGFGRQTCTNNVWGVCEDEVTADVRGEVCGNGLDDNCDGRLDEGVDDGAICFNVWENAVSVMETALRILASVTVEDDGTVTIDLSHLNYLNEREARLQAVSVAALEIRTVPDNVLN